MDMSEDCWEHVGLLQDVANPEAVPPPPAASEYLIHHQEVRSLIDLSTIGDTETNPSSYPANLHPIHAEPHLQTHVEVEAEVPGRNELFEPKGEKYVMTG